MPRWIVAPVALTVAMGGWIGWAARTEGADARPVLATLGVAVAAYLLGILLRPAVVVVAAVALVGLALVLATGNDALSRNPLADPLGYSNANGALYVQVAALAGMAAPRLRHPLARVVFGGALLGCVLLPVVIGSVAATVGAVLVAAASLVAAGPRSHGVIRHGVIRPAAAVAAVVLVLAAGATVVLAERYGDGRLDPVCLFPCPPESQAARPAVVNALSERRIELWRDAERLVRAHPVSGVGPGRFGAFSDVARTDPDTHAAHSALLEQAAESGLPGGLLLLAVWLSVLAALGWGAARAPTLVALAAWLAVCLHMLVDYVADFPAVVVTAALVAGLGVPAGGRRRA